jgi:hypothetical protein
MLDRGLWILGEAFPITPFGRVRQPAAHGPRVTRYVFSSHLVICERFDCCPCRRQSGTGPKGVRSGPLITGLFDLWQSSRRVLELLDDVGLASHAVPLPGQVAWHTLKAHASESPFPRMSLRGGVSRRGNRSVMRSRNDCHARCPIRALGQALTRNDTVMACRSRQCRPHAYLIPNASLSPWASPWPPDRAEWFQGTERSGKPSRSLSSAQCSDPGAKCSPPPSARVGRAAESFCPKSIQTATMNTGHTWQVGVE